MGLISIEKLLPRANGSIYGLVRMAAKRALELSDGEKPLVDINTDKLTTIALQEILEGKIESKESAALNAKKGKEAESVSEQEEE